MCILTYSVTCYLKMVTDIACLRTCHVPILRNFQIYEDNNIFFFSENNQIWSYLHELKICWSHQKLLVWVVLDLLSLSKVSNSIWWMKNGWDGRDPIKSGQLGFLTKISHWQNWWILHSNDTVYKYKCVDSLYFNNLQRELLWLSK